MSEEGGPEDGPMDRPIITDKMPDQEKQSIETISFEYWPRPRQRFIKQMRGSKDSREPQYLEAMLVKDVIQLLFPDVAKGELTITPPLETITNGHVKQPIHAEYNGPREGYIRTIDIKLTNDGGPFKVYDIEVTSTPNAIETATTILQTAVYEGRLKHEGRFARKKVTFY